MTDRPDDGPPSATPGAPPHVLVVDDNEAHVEIIRRELEDDGLPVRITVARTLARCRDLIRRDPPALALIDLNLPDGLATDLLPRDDGEAEFPIVIMTAAGSEAMAAGAIRAGAHDYICKSPQAFAGIARTVHAALREWRHIQARRDAVKALASSEAQYRELLDATGDGIFVKDPDFRYVLCNVVHAARLGLQPADLLGRTDHDLAPIADNALYRATDEQVLATGAPITFEEVQGGRVYETRKFAVRLIDGRRGIAAGIRDITERRAADAKTMRLAAAVDQIPESVIITEPDGTIVYTNPAFERTSGYSSAEVAGLNPRILRSGVQDGRFYADMWATLAAGRVWSGRFINRRKDGTVLHVDGVVSPLRNAAGRLMGYAAVERDVTEAVQEERDQRQGQKLEALGTLAAGIAHDFNNMLQNIMSLTENSLADLPEAGAATADMEAVLEACERAGGLIRQIRSFAHSAEADTLEAIDPHPVVAEALRLLRVAVPPSVSLHAALSRQACRIKADPVQLHQVVMNLCTNAYQSVGHGDRAIVNVSLAPETLDAAAAALVRETAAGGTGSAIVPGHFVTLRVEDTGQGIAPEHLERIFDPYFSTKSQVSNSGLGLATVHGIVRGHHAAITVRSRPGEGSAFAVYFPAVPVAEPELDRHASQDPAPRGTESILYVDDEPGIGRSAKRSLERLGYRVKACTSPMEALATLNGDPGGYDLLITDMAMPGMTGLELATLARKANPRLAMILCTGFADPSSLEALRPAGMAAVLQKPVSSHAVAVAVRQALDAGL